MNDIYILKYNIIRVYQNASLFQFYINLLITLFFILGYLTCTIKSHAGEKLMYALSATECKIFFKGISIDCLCKLCIVIGVINFCQYKSSLNNS